MDHQTFVKRYRNDEIAVDVDRNKAGFMYQQPGLIPQELRGKQAMIRTIGLAGVLIAIALYFFVPWWAATAVLILALSMFPKAQKNAAEGVLHASLDSPHIYQTAVENGVVRVRELP